MNTSPENQPRFREEPWHDELQLTELLQDLRSTLHRFVILTDEQSLAIALWIIHTYFIRQPSELQLFEHSPILFITSPEKQCGKSTLRDCIQRLVCNPFNSMNASQASIYRTIQITRPTLLLDEFDNFELDRKALIGILNSGYQPDGAVTRQGGKNYEETQTFSTWCPKVLAGIGNIPSTLQSRCITIKLRRKFNHEKIERRNAALREDPNLFNDLRRKIIRLVNDYEQELLIADYVAEEDLDDRVQDNWFGLFKVAKLIGADELYAAIQAAKELSRDDHEDQSDNILLLSDLSHYEQIKISDLVKTADLLAYLLSIEDRPWSNYNGRPLSAFKMSEKLRIFDIRAHLIRFGDKPMRGYRCDAFREAFARYL